jgi:hypothetical protein
MDNTICDFLAYEIVHPGVFSKDSLFLPFCLKLKVSKDFL